MNRMHALCALSDLPDKWVAASAVAQEAQGLDSSLDGDGREAAPVLQRLEDDGLVAFQDSGDPAVPSLWRITGEGEGALRDWLLVVLGEGVGSSTPERDETETNSGAGS